MKVGIAYDGATWQVGKKGRKRRTLDRKVAHAGFESAETFRERKEGVVSSRFDVKKGLRPDSTDSAGGKPDRRSPGLP